MASVRVLIVEGDPMLRSFLEEALRREREIEVAGAVGESGSALAGAAALRPDAVLVDLDRVGPDGLELVRALAEGEAGVRVLAMTDGGDELLVAAFRAGARGFLTRRTARRDVADALRIVAAGGVWADARIQALLAEHAPSGRAAREAAVAALTARQREVLALLGLRLSDRQIAGRLGIGLRTAKRHVSDILSRLDLANRHQAGLFAREQGLVPQEGGDGVQAPE